MIPSDQMAARMPHEPEGERCGTTPSAAVRVTAHTGGGAGLVLVGAACGPPTLVVCAALAAVVMLAGLLIPQRSEDRLRLWLALVAAPRPGDRPRADESAGSGQ